MDFSYCVVYGGGERQRTLIYVILEYCQHILSDRPVSAPKLVSTSTPSWSASKLVGNLEEAEILPTFKTPTARPTKSPVKMVSPKTPESASRGRMFAEMARLKAVTPVSSSVKYYCTTSTLVGIIQKFHFLASPLH